LTSDKDKKETIKKKIKTAVSERTADLMNDMDKKRIIKEEKIMNAAIGKNVLIHFDKKGEEVHQIAEKLAIMTSDDLTNNIDKMETIKEKKKNAISEKKATKKEDKLG
jgi:hypothetical protein